MRIPAYCKWNKMNVTVKCIAFLPCLLEVLSSNVTRKNFYLDRCLLTFPTVPLGEHYCGIGQNSFHIIPNSSLTIILSLGTILPTQPKSIIRQMNYSLQPLKTSLMVGKHINWRLYDGTVPSVKVNRNTTPQVFWDVMLHQLVNSDWHDYTLITNLMHWLLFIHKILFSSTCFEHQVLIFRRT